MKKVSNKRKRKARKSRGYEVLVLDKYASIKKAAENPRYKFRTISGLMKEAHVSAEDVTEVVNVHPDEFVVLHRHSQNGQQLITTRAHYEKNASLSEKLMGALLNRVY